MFDGDWSKIQIPTFYTSKGGRDEREQCKRSELVHK